MKVLFLVLSTAVCAFASSAATQAQLHRRATTHINNILETFPPSVTLVQLHAQMLSEPNAIEQGLDELATLLFKLQKDISLAKKNGLADNIRVQGNCDRERYRIETRIKYYITHKNMHWKEYGLTKAKREAVPAKWQANIVDMAKMNAEIRRLNDKINQEEKARVEAHELYLQNIADFNKALDDVDMLRTLVETKLANRGAGSDNDVRHTMNPTKVGETATFSPTVKGEVFKGQQAHEFVERSTKFLEIASNDELASMSNEEAAEAMKGIYANLRNSVHSNPMVVALVNTLDSVMIQVQSGNGGAVDKIRELLIEVRNELQKNKRILTKDEITATNAHQQSLLSLFAQIGDLKIEIMRKEIENGEYKEQYGVLWTKEARSRSSYEYNRMYQKHTELELAYKNYLCLVLKNKFILADAKRVKQLGQIKKALDVLYGIKKWIPTATQLKLNTTIDEVTINMCRQFTSESKWVSVASAYNFGSRRTTYAMARNTQDMVAKNTPQAALDVYKDKNAQNQTYACISKWKFSYTCTRNCDIRFTDQRFPKDSFSSNTNYPKNQYARVAHYTKVTQFNHKNVAEVRLGKPMVYQPSSVQFRDLVYGYAGANSVTRNNIEIFVVPGCNCDPKVNKDYIVDPNWKV